MPNPTQGDVHVDAILTSISVAHVQDERLGALERHLSSARRSARSLAQGSGAMTSPDGTMWGGAVEARTTRDTAF